MGVHYKLKITKKRFATFGLDCLGLIFQYNIISSDRQNGSHTFVYIHFIIFFLQGLQIPWEPSSYFMVEFICIIFCDKYFIQRYNFKNLKIVILCKQKFIIYINRLLNLHYLKIFCLPCGLFNPNK